MVACSICYDACLKENDIGRMRDCIRLDRECADMCELAAKSISQGSPFVREICALCADICDACGKECEKHMHEHCKHCAEACFACAQACRNMAA